MVNRNTKPRTNSLNSVRMLEVAALAQVSTMTVSRALRNPDSVSGRTLLRVSDAIATLGYIPNQLAASLKTPNSTKVVGVIVPNVKNAIFADTLKGLSDELRTHGFSILLADSNYSSEEEHQLIVTFLSQRPRAIILHETEHLAQSRTLLQRADIPIVEIGTLTGRPIDMAVSYSNVAAGKAMTEHLLGRGYRRIGFVSLSASNTRSRERLQGYKVALQKAGTLLDRDIILATDGGYAAGVDAMATLLDIRPSVDAVFFAGDVLVVGGLLECQRRGIVVPSQVAIAGFDDLEILSQLTPTLTSLRVPRYEIGQQAARLIVNRLDGIQSEEFIDVGFEIIEREST